MAQTGFTPIQIYHSSVATNVPLAADLLQGELAINIADGKLYYKDASNAVQLLVSAGTGGGTVTSVSGSGGTTGLTVSGGPITSTGTLTLGGTLAIANGGTGQTTANTALNALLPNQATNAGKLLSTDGSNTSWITVSSGTITAVNATFPATSTGGATPNIGISNGGGACTSTTGTGALVFNTNPTITNYTESVVAIGTVTSSNALSLTNGTVQTATLTASTACTFTMPTATAGKSFVLLLKQAAATGNGTATFTGVKWPSVGAPIITSTAGKMDILTFVADGTNWYGTYVQGYTP